MEHDTDGAVRLAALDMQRNLRRLSGKVDGFHIVDGDHQCGILIKTVENGEHEAYTVHVDKEKVTIIGSDTLGTVFGIYAFATKCLHVLPVYRLTDLFPDVTEELILEKQSFSSKKRPVRFRGWFLNDEDLLTEWKTGGGHRNIDYPFYQEVMDTDVLDMILETALRLEINLVIPSSFVDIDNPDEEKLVQAVCRRGMYVSQHHVEPMGVSYFGAKRYLQKRGCEGEEISFISNRERMEEIWGYYAKKWARYGAHVIWQLGLRGKGDQAVWKSDPNAPITMEARGDIITDAIQTQYRLIQETLGDARFYSTATLWNEGSELYGNGFLKLPATTIPIFSDFGIDQMFGEDLYRVGLRADRAFGIYYHAAFWALGPHLTEGCNPEKMAYCYRDAAKSNTLCYSILNISNVRPLHISAMVNARILQSPSDPDAVDLLRIDRELFGEDAELVNELRRSYYEAFADFGTAPLKEAADAWHFYLRDYDTLSFIRNAVTDGQLAWLGKNMLQDKHSTGVPMRDTRTLNLLIDSAERFATLDQKAADTESCLSKKSILYFKQFIQYQIRHMRLLTEWCVACMRFTDETLPLAERKSQGIVACASLERLLKERKILEAGPWQNWHRGEKKINIQNLLELTHNTYNRLTQ